MTEESGLRRVLILADESANWEVAGLRQLDRLALAIDEAVAKNSPNERTRVFVRWETGDSTERWLPADERLSRVDLIETSSDETADLILNTHMFPFRGALAQATEAGQLSEQSWRKKFGYYLHSREEIAESERAFLRRGGKSQDGLVSRFLNRPISRAVSRQLLKYPVTPSGWTLFIVVLPLLGSLLLARGSYASIVWGLLLFHFYSVLDGCDGEIARAKFLESEKGRRLDNLCDIASNLLLAIALGIGLGGNFVAEGFVVAALIAANEWFLAKRHSRAIEEVTAPSDSPIYPRHRELWKNSGIGVLGDRFTYWLVQLTKRDVAMLFFVVLGLIGRPAWILHLLGATAALSLGLALKAKRAGDR